jgi:hypothetical protein
MKVAGIDVAHKTLGVVVSVEEKAGKAAQVERVCLEATGSYRLGLALARTRPGWH